MLIMIENLEFKILHLKADGCHEDPVLRVHGPSTAERSNQKKAAGRIPRFSDRSQPSFPKFENSTSTDFKRNLKQLKSEFDSDSHVFHGKSRNMGGGLLTCDASPHSPWINFLSRKTVVGAGLLVRYAAHIAELIKHTSSIQTNIKNPHLQHIEHGIELCGLNVTLLGSSFEKILSPGKITFAGDIRRDE
jgi:hypothetical protein